MRTAAQDGRGYTLPQPWNQRDYASGKTEGNSWGCLLVAGRGLDDGAAAAHDGGLGRGLDHDGGTGEESGHVEKLGGCGYGGAVRERSERRSVPGRKKKRRLTSTSLPSLTVVATKAYPVHRTRHVDDFASCRCHRDRHVYCRRRWQRHVIAPVHVYHERRRVRQWSSNGVATKIIKLVSWPYRATRHRSPPTGSAQNYSDPPIGSARKVGTK